MGFFQKIKEFLKIMQSSAATALIPQAVCVHAATVWTARAELCVPKKNRSHTASAGVAKEEAARTALLRFTKQKNLGMHPQVLPF